ncbi:GIY-YIG nuclease family protein [Paenisporosarcina sp. TG20]|uniref:GIY-YIG nuclease family protein n=1 Tax=Paenisporosarcina sp. TG20 TaxID=1211706 RepID=UPI0003062743|nr:GIY-YIG nuclease family protein [Paenisporosarcina sp. TG20]
MSLFSKLFSSIEKATINENQKRPEEVNNFLKQVSEQTSTDDTKHIGGLGVEINISAEGNKVSITSLPVGVSTGSIGNNFYVYEWFINESGEIFYVGKGRGNRYKEFHQRAYEAEKIRKTYDTDTRFVATGLTEDQAIGLESEEMTRILNETNDRLTNRIIPLLTKRDNGYDRSLSTPEI